MDASPLRIGYCLSLSSGGRVGRSCRSMPELQVSEVEKQAAAKENA